MNKATLSACVVAVVAVAAFALTSPAPEAAPKCVDPDSCPIIVCPPGYELVPTTCKECAHCEPTQTCRGKRPCETPL